jgi:hypothetical protein
MQCQPVSKPIPLMLVFRLANPAKSSENLIMLGREVSIGIKEMVAFAFSREDGQQLIFIQISKVRNGK